MTALRLVASQSVAEILAELELPSIAIDDAREHAVAEQRKRDEVEELERERELRARRMADSGWCAREVAAAASADETKQAIAHVKAWEPTKRNILILGGTAGAGKTTAAAWWAIRQKSTPRFLSAVEYARSSRYDSDKRESWLKAGALVLDDIGSEWNDSKGSFRVDVDELVNAFYRGMRPLLCTTNIATIDEFRRAYGERVVDRLRECGRWATCTNESLRRQPR